MSSHSFYPFFIAFGASKKALIVLAFCFANSLLAINQFIKAGMLKRRHSNPVKASDILFMCVLKFTLQKQKNVKNRNSLKTNGSDFCI